MPFSEDTRDLTKSFRTTQDLLKQLLTGLQKRRAAWVSARPSSLEPSPELELLTQAIAREEAVRDELLARIRLVLPRPLGAEPRELHLNVTRIAAALPPTEARALCAAAEATTKLAKSVRAEVTLGQRLVRFAQDSQPALLVAPVTAGRRPAGIPGYDRSARALRTASTAGSLIDGRM
ncbi:MAG: hypothetical protein U1F60_05285 [Planctomycetota bacterium]